MFGDNGWSEKHMYKLSPWIIVFLIDLAHTHILHSTHSVDSISSDSTRCRCVFFFLFFFNICMWNCLQINCIISTNLKSTHFFLATAFCFVRLTQWNLFIIAQSKYNAGKKKPAKLPESTKNMKWTDTRKKKFTFIFCRSIFWLSSRYLGRSNLNVCRKFAWTQSFSYLWFSLPLAFFPVCTYSLAKQRDNFQPKKNCTSTFSQYRRHQSAISLAEHGKYELIVGRN